MNPEEKAQYKQEARDALFEYLQNNNLMEAANEEIMGHLPNMFRHLEEKGLVKFGLTFPMFQSFAEDQFFIAILKGIE